MLSRLKIRPCIFFTFRLMLQSMVFYNIEEVSLAETIKEKESCLVKLTFPKDPMPAFHHCDKIPEQLNWEVDLVMVNWLQYY